MRQQRLEYATHGPARAEQQNALARQRHTGVQQIAYQPGTVGVVTEQAPVFELLQGIHRAGPTGALGELIRHAIGLFLERHGDIGALAIPEKRPGEPRKVIQRRQQCLVAKRVAGLRGEQGVNLR